VNLSLETGFSPTVHLFLFLATNLKVRTRTAGCLSHTTLLSEYLKLLYRNIADEAIKTERKPLKNASADPLPPEPEQFFGRKEVLYLTPFPHPQHLAEASLIYTVRGGLMDWYLVYLRYRIYIWCKKWCVPVDAGKIFYVPETNTISLRNCC
jgi:hypothetical protein